MEGMGQEFEAVDEARSGATEILRPIYDMHTPRRDGEQIPPTRNRLNTG